MNVLTAILLVFIFSLIIANGYLLSFLIKSIKNNKKILEEYNNALNENIKNLEEIKTRDNTTNELLNDYVLMDVAHSIVFMLLNLSHNNEEKYSYYFNSLYFFGVPKEYLENFDKISEFHNNCINHKYWLYDGEAPFKYKFVLKNENQNETES
jgi:hypothetical protein